MLQKAAQPFRVLCDAVVVLLGALRKGSSMKQMPRSAEGQICSLHICAATEWRAFVVSRLGFQRLCCSTSNQQTYSVNGHRPQ